MSSRTPIEFENEAKCSWNLNMESDYQSPSYLSQSTVTTERGHNRKRNRNRRNNTNHYNSRYRKRNRKIKHCTEEQDHYNRVQYSNSQGTWAVKSKPKLESIPFTESKVEVNTSSATILYCGPDAKCSDHIVQIKPNEAIPVQPEDCIRIIAMGCTHELHRHVYIPRGDLLIHAGDTCNWRRYTHTQQEYGYETPWDIWTDMVSVLDSQRNGSKRNVSKSNPKSLKPHNFRFGMIVIPGNHDLYAEGNTNRIRSLLKEHDITFLVNERHSVDINDRKIRLFGSPISWYRNKPSCAYQLHRKRHSDLWCRDERDQMNKHWDEDYIATHFPHDENVDIMITHGPPAGYGDCEELGRCTGSHALLKYIQKIKPKIFISCDYHGSGGEGDSHGYGVHFLHFEDSHQSQDVRKLQKLGHSFTEEAVDKGSAKTDYCIIMNVAMAHQPARYMRGDNIRRGVTIVDAKLDQITSK